jgi:general secretion pathway protein F
MRESRHLGTAHQDIRQTDILIFLEQLRDLLVAGLSLIEALQAVRSGAPSSIQARAAFIVERLREGQAFSTALLAEGSFPLVLVALVRTSELTSSLPQALSGFLDHERRARELRHRVVSLATYPLMVIAVGVSVFAFLAFYVMPRFAVIFQGMTGSLPWSARAMLAWSTWLAAHRLGSLIGVALGIGSIAAAVIMPTARAWTLQWLLDFAPLRTRLRTYFLARWYRATGMLLQGGIPLPEALSLSQVVLPVALRPGGAAVERAIRDGHSPAEAHRRGSMTTPVSEQLLRAGERTGDLGGVLTRIADFHEAEVTRQLERAMRTLEPVVMTLIGIGVGVVVVLMYLPIFELASAVQ